MHHHEKRTTNRKGVILLVVLSSLTFFSILVAAYLVFSNESRDASLALSKRSTREPDVNWIMNEALMTLVRGTNDPSNPFYGEDLLSDFYGHDGLSLQVKNINQYVLGPQLLGVSDPNDWPLDELTDTADKFTGFVRFPASSDGVARPSLPARNDVYAGRLVTFTSGPLANRTYRVMRSVYNLQSGTAWDDLYIDLDDVGMTSGATLRNLLSYFYDDPTDITKDGYTFIVNGAPRNSPGVGFDGNNLNNTISDVPELAQKIPGTNTNTGFTGLPIALQPNHFGRDVDKSKTPGDFDEDYDAPDHNNWWLSLRRDDGTVIPSFHRPAVLNYLVNELPDWSNATNDEFNDLIASLQRGTFRPLPIAQNQLGNGSPTLNERFTGGSPEYALRTALPMNNNPARLNQLLQALISGEWDVDNDGDGTADSVWVDVGLPTFTTRDGKLMRPLIAPMIEDLGGRLNLNAHSNVQLNPLIGTAGLQSNQQAKWAAAAGSAQTPAVNLFRGLGWGPSEITIPQLANVSAGHATNLKNAIDARYEYGHEKRGSTFQAGRNGRDAVDALLTGFRPVAHTATGGFGYGTDPFGRKGTAIGRSGHLLVAGQANAATVDESYNTPYEQDPTGNLSGDTNFKVSDLEALLRSNDFDSELLPAELRERLQSLIGGYNDPNNANQLWYEHVFTAKSTSSDHPTFSLEDLIERLNGVNQYSSAKMAELVAPELRLGRKLDVNRAIGNLVDDNNNLVIDEPVETASTTEAARDGFDNDRDGSIDAQDADGDVGEKSAFKIASGATGAIPNDFANATPYYRWDEANNQNNQIPIEGRQLLARHLYVLMMALSRDIDTQNNSQESFFPPTDPNRTFDDIGVSEEAYKARRLAQWAVNVVDYRDPDSIMTRFVFDANPFDANGWNPPADLATSPASAEFVVWGVESPELLLSESMAFHDVRLRDDDRDDGSGEFKNSNDNPDNDSDQVRMPQGSLFLELYCPHPTQLNDQGTKPSFPMELYQQQAGDGSIQLKLDATAPNLAGGVGGAPVWRIAISERHDEFADAAQRDLSPARLRDPNFANRLPDTASFELPQPNELGPNGNLAQDSRLDYDRFIWFTNVENADTNPDAAFNAIGNLINSNNISDMVANKVFIAPSFDQDNITNSDRNLEPGQFLTLTPRLETIFGSNYSRRGKAKELGVGNGNGNGNGNALQPDGLSEQRWVTFPNEGLVQFFRDDARKTPTLAAAGEVGTPALPLVIAAPRPAGWAIPAQDHPNLAQNVVGISVSEPLPRGGNYYPQPGFQYFQTADTDFDEDGEPDYFLTDAYLDYSDPNKAKTAKDEPLDISRDRIPNVNNEPLLGTIEDYCSALLQRLADPTKPYNAVTNPYRTVDWLPIDLTVFSGEDRENKISVPGDYTRRSRQRNGHIRQISNGGSVAANSLYSYETDFSSPNVSIAGRIGGAYFRFTTTDGGTPHLQSSFSFLNTAQADVNPDFAGFAATLGSLGSPASDGVIGNDRNLPQTPYAIHPWLNRPFASAMEIMMVPACSQGRLFEELSFNPTGESDVFCNGTNDQDPTIVNAPFRHLLNFFHSSGTPGDGMEFARVFDFVNTLPRFRGEVELISPSRLWGTTNNPVAMPTAFRSLLGTPFNIKYDNYRQGTINLNTISKFPVWAGLMQGHMTASEFSSPNSSTGQFAYDNFQQVRRGYNVSRNTQPTKVTAGAGPYNYAPSYLNSAFPTEFGGVFRPGVHANKAIQTRVNGAGQNGSRDQLRRTSVNGGLMRDTANLTATTPAQTSMFVRRADQLPITTGGNNPSLDRLRNPFMRQQTLMRMPNLVSDNSQVFLVRMTVGFFEVDAATQSLGREYNAEIGGSQRYQGTFVIDRSIPVGFSPGSDLNARDVVIFESYAQ